MKQVLRVVVLGLALGLLPVGTSPGETEPRPNHLTQLKKARAEAARQTFDTVWKNFLDGPVPSAELPHRWSCRWLEAERALGEPKAQFRLALRAHFLRMQEMERITKERFRARVTTIDEVQACEYYRLEAEIWYREAPE
jgi:hypothetical protein